MGTTFQLNWMGLRGKWFTLVKVLLMDSRCFQEMLSFITKRRIFTIQKLNVALSGMTLVLELIEKHKNHVYLSKTHYYDYSKIFQLSEILLRH